MQENMVGQNIIITERLSTLRQLGRNALRGKWKVAILAIIVFLICKQLPVIVFNHLFGYNMGNMVMSGDFTYNMDPETFMQAYNQLPQYSILSLIYVLLVSGAFELGLSLFFLASFRGHMVEVKDVFLGFERFGKALGLFLYQYLWILLWTLLFIIPGIIAAIRYSQAFFILADDPEKGVIQCMDESKAMMKGNKASYFLLSLSFIGWLILAIIPGGILQGIVETMTTNLVVHDVTTMITDLFLAPVYVYVYSTFAGFYEILAGHLIKETKPAPLSADQIVTDAPVEAIEEVIEAEEAKEEAMNQAMGETPVAPEAPVVPEQPVAPDEPAIPEEFIQDTPEDPFRPEGR